MLWGGGMQTGTRVQACILLRHGHNHVGCCPLAAACPLQDTTPSKSSPIAQQRLKTMSAAAAALEEAAASQEQEPPQQKRPGGGGGGGADTTWYASASSSADRSISFGSVGCSGAAEAGEAGGEAAEQAAPPERAPSRRIAGLEGTARLAALARLLEGVEQQGRRVSLAELRAAGFSTHDLAALRAWLARHA